MAVIVLVCEKPGAGEQSSHDVTLPGLVKRLQAVVAILPERLCLVAPGCRVCGCLGTHLIREIPVSQTNPTPRVFIWRRRMPHAPRSKLVGTDPVSRAAAALRSCPHPSCLQWPTQGLLCSQQGDDCPPSHPGCHSPGRVYWRSTRCLPSGSHCFSWKVQIVG